MNTKNQTLVASIDHADPLPSAVKKQNSTSTFPRSQASSQIEVTPTMLPQIESHARDQDECLHVDLRNEELLRGQKFTADSSKEQLPNNELCKDAQTKDKSPRQPKAASPGKETLGNSILYYDERKSLPSPPLDSEAQIKARLSEDHSNSVREPPKEGVLLRSSQQSDHEDSTPDSKQLGQDYEPSDPYNVYPPGRGSISSTSTISSKTTVLSEDTEIARDFRRDFVPVRLSTPGLSGIFKRSAAKHPALAFIDNGSSACFVSLCLCNRIHAYPKLMLDASKQYLGPVREPLKVAGQVRLQVCWQSEGYEVGYKINFNVIDGLTYEIIITFEMAKTTKMDLAAGPHPDRLSNHTVAPISSALMPVRNQQQKAEAEKIKAEKKLENERREAERKRLNKTPEP